MPVLLAGAVVALGGMWTLPARERTMALLGAVLFPIVFVVGTGATLYDDTELLATAQQELAQALRLREADPETATQYAQAASQHA